MGSSGGRRWVLGVVVSLGVWSWGACGEEGIDLPRPIDALPQEPDAGEPLDGGIDAGTDAGADGGRDGGGDDDDDDDDDAGGGGEPLRG